MKLDKMSRREKMRYLKSKGFKIHATMRNVELDKMLDMDAPPEVEEVKGSKRVRRGKRVPLGQHRSKLSVDSFDIPKNKVPRWVNDVGGRIRDALEGGYEFLNDPTKDASVGEDPLQPQGMGSAVSTNVGVRDDGTAIRGYLMVIDKDLYDEDQDYKMEEQRALKKAIEGGRFESNPQDGKYLPGDGISIK